MTTGTETALTPASLPPEFAAGGALAGTMLLMVGFLAGSLSVGVAGLTVIGLAAGLHGSVRHRLLVAAAVWAVATALAVAGTLFGPQVFEIAAPVVFGLLFVALGQALGLLAGIFIQRPIQQGR